MRAAIYARVSTTDQKCEMQLRDLRTYLKQRGWKKTGEYVDTMSGSKASRPALDKLMRDASEGQFDIVLVWKLDRFGRSVLNLLQQIQQLTSYRTRFIATSQGIDTDAANPVSRLIVHILSAVAEFERDLIRERTRAGLANARANGVQLGRQKRVFRRDQIQPLRAEGLSWRAIAKKLRVPLGTVFAAKAPRSGNVRPEQRSENPLPRRKPKTPKQRT